MLNKSKTALIVVDVQNAFCDAKNLTPQRKQQIDDVVAKIEVAINKARIKKKQIIFTKMIYDFSRQFLPKTITSRFIKQHGHSDFLIPGSISTKLYHLKPMNHDIVFEKAYYDPFCEQKFHPMLQDLNITSLIVCGFYLDICVDSLLRTAYQRGYDTILLSDATLTMIQEEEKTRSLINFCYNTTITNVCDCLS